MGAFLHKSLTAPLHFRREGGPGGGHRAPRPGGRQGDRVPQDGRPLQSVRIRITVWIRIHRGQAAPFPPGTSSSQAKAHLYIQGADPHWVPAPASHSRGG